MIGINDFVVAPHFSGADFVYSVCVEVMEEISVIVPILVRRALLIIFKEVRLGGL